MRESNHVRNHALECMRLAGEATVKVYKDGVLQVSGYTLHAAGGWIRFDVAPANGVAVTFDCEFDVPVRFAQCVVPDTFRDVPGMDVGVTVEGSLLADNSFEATTVLAKCPSKYEMKERQGKGEQMPHGLDQNPTATQ